MIADDVANLKTQQYSLEKQGYYFIFCLNQHLPCVYPSMKSIGVDKFSEEWFFSPRRRADNIAGSLLPSES